MRFRTSLRQGLAIASTSTLAMNFGNSFRAAILRFRPPSASSGQTRPSKSGPSPRPRPCTTAAGAGAVGPLLSLNPFAATTVRLGSALVLAGGSAGFALSQSSEGSEGASTADLAWVQDLASKPSITEVRSPGQMLRQHPIGKFIAEQDHLASDWGADSQSLEWSMTEMELTQ